MKALLAGAQRGKLPMDDEAKWKKLAPFWMSAHWYGVDVVAVGRLRTLIRQAFEPSDRRHSRNRVPLAILAMFCTGRPVMRLLQEVIAGRGAH